MSSFSHCPDCRQPVAIPDGADPAARVRCPHCHCEFSLSDTLSDRADGPPDVILVTSSAAAPPAVEVSPETARLDQEASELAEEASWLQNRAEGLQVTAHTSDPEPEAAAALAEALDSEAEALAAKADAIVDPVETPDKPTARPATVVGAYRALGGALVATADALDAVVEVIHRKVVGSQPEASEQPPIAELKSDLAAALTIDEHHHEDEDDVIGLELPEPTLEDEAPSPIGDDELLFPEEPAATEPAAGEQVVTEPAATEPVAAEPATGEPSVVEAAVTESAAAEPAVTEPVAAEPPTGEPSVVEGAVTEPVATEPAAPAESPVVDASPLLLKAANLRSKAEALRARGERLLKKADALKAAAGIADEDLEAGEDGQEGDYAFHGDWAAAGGAAGQSAGAATAAGGTALPFPIIPRKERKPKSAVRTFVSIVLGGVTGLVLTYLILNLVSDQYEGGIWPWRGRHPLMRSDATTPPTPAKPSKPPKNAKPSSPLAAKPGAPGSHAGPEKPPAGKADSLPSLPELKPASLDTPSGDTVPTTLPSGDTLPEATTSPSKPAETEPKPPPADAKFGKVVDIDNPKGYGSDDLVWPLRIAQDAFKGDLKPESYQPLCRLAETLTFIDPRKGVTGLAAEKAAIEKLLRDVGERDKHKNVKVIAQLADKWLDNPGRDCAGVLLAGRIQKITETPHGMSLAFLALAKPNPKAPTERTIKMISRGPFDFQEKDAVIVLGALAVIGTGDRRELVVWHGTTIKFAVPPPKPK